MRVVVLCLSLGMIAAACGDDGASDAALTFYEPATVLSSGEPGELLSQSPIELNPEMNGTGFEVEYVSTTPAGDPVPVTGVIIQPAIPPPDGGYPVVVWAHGTTGIGDDCAPSNFAPITIPGAAALLDAGYIVAAPDYEGLGVADEIHPYLVGEAAGHNVLDAARAAGELGGGDVTVAWGWSQGGHAALFARSLQPEYAPELDFRGAAAHAPVTDAGTFLRPGLVDPVVFPFAAEAVLGWAEVYEQTELLDLVVVEDAETARLARQGCTGDIAEGVTRPPEDVFRSDPENVDPWQAALEVNSVVVGDTTAPVVIAHGDADPLVPIAGTEALFDQLCAEEVATQLMREPDWDHNLAYAEAIDDVVTWIGDRFAGEPAPADCPA